MKWIVSMAFLALLTPLTGVAAECASPQKARIEWDALPTGPTYAVVDHVELHRADGSCASASNFVKIYEGAVDVLAIDDVNVAGGQTYCWVAYSFGTDGRQSGPSNKAECAIPLAPLPVVPNLRAK